MQENDYSLGGEQSGHIILKKYATTGDGLLTSIMLTEEICDLKVPLSKLVEEVCVYPQITKNVKVKDKTVVMEDADIKKALLEIEKKIGGKGRILLRKSGTEPVIRIMAESETEKSCYEYCDTIAQIIYEKGYSFE